LVSDIFPRVTGFLRVEIVPFNERVSKDKMPFTETYARVLFV
jgi:hypothetical protein